MSHLKPVKGKSIERGVDRATLFKPTIHLEEEQLKEIRDWDVGRNYTLILEVVQKSKNENSDKKISASFEIVKIATPNKTFNKQAMEDFRKGKLKNGQRVVRNFNEAMKVAQVSKEIL